MRIINNYYHIIGLFHSINPFKNNMLAKLATDILSRAAFLLCSPYLLISKRAGWSYIKKNTPLSIRSRLVLDNVPLSIIDRTFDKFYDFYKKCPKETKNIVYNLYAKKIYYFTSEDIESILILFTTIPVENRTLYFKHIDKVIYTGKSPGNVLIMLNFYSKFNNNTYAQVSEFIKDIYLHSSPIDFQKFYDDHLAALNIAEREKLLSYLTIFKFYSIQNCYTWFASISGISETNKPIYLSQLSRLMGYIDYNYNTNTVRKILRLFSKLPLMKIEAVIDFFYKANLLKHNSSSLDRFTALGFLGEFLHRFSMQDLEDLLEIVDLRRPSNMDNLNPLLSYACKLNKEQFNALKSQMNLISTSYGLEYFKNNGASILRNICKVIRHLHPNDIHSQNLELLISFSLNSKNEYNFRKLVQIELLFNCLTYEERIPALNYAVNNILSDGSEALWIYDAIKKEPFKCPTDRPILFVDHDPSTELYIWDMPDSTRITFFFLKYGELNNKLFIPPIDIIEGTQFDILDTHLNMAINRYLSNTDNLKKSHEYLTRLLQSDLLPGLKIQVVQLILKEARMLQIDETHPLYLLASETLSSCSDEHEFSPNNPHILYQQFHKLAASESLIEYTPPPENVLDQSVSWNLDTLRKEGRQTFWDKLTREVLPKGISMASITPLFDSLKLRIAGLPSAQKTEILSVILVEETSSINSIYDNIITMPFLSQVLNSPDNPNGTISRQLYMATMAIQNILEAPHDLAPGELITPREEKLVLFARAIAECNTGKNDALIDYYNRMPENLWKGCRAHELPKSIGRTTWNGLWTEVKTSLKSKGDQKHLHKIRQIESHVINTTFFQNLLAIPQDPHAEISYTQYQFLTLLKAVSDLKSEKRSEALFKHLKGIHRSSRGIREGIERRYNKLGKSYMRAHTVTSNAEFQKVFIYQSIQAMMKTVFNSPGFFEKLTHIKDYTQLSHAGDFFANRFHMQLGYSHEIILDPSTPVLPLQLINYMDRPGDFLEMFFKEFTIESVIKQIIIDSTTSLLDNVQRNDLLELIPNAEGRMTYDEDTGQSVLTEQGALECLTALQLVKIA
ncbi:MAG: hypothetical protein WC222_08370 [Parachlamydiales bacterium]|jgi:hypothetical protein